MKTFIYTALVSVWALLVPLSSGYSQGRMPVNSMSFGIVEGEVGFEDLATFLQGTSFEENDYFDGRAHIYVRFEEGVDESILSRLATLGGYIAKVLSEDVCVLAVPRDFNFRVLTDWGIVGVAKVTIESKLDDNVMGPIYPETADLGGELAVRIAHYTNLTKSIVQSLLTSEGIQVVGSDKEGIHALIAKSDVYNIARLPYVHRITAIDANQLGNNTTPTFASIGMVEGVEGLMMRDTEMLTADLFLSGFNVPGSVGCADPAAPISLVVFNIGTSTLTNFSAGYSINGGAYVVETFNTTMAPGTNVTALFSTPANLTSGGTITAFVEASGDVNSSNDSASVTMVANPVVSSYPYFEDFEDSGALDPMWAQGTDDAGVNWLVDVGGTPSTNTGPPVDHTLGTSAGHYVYMEDSGSELFPIDLYSPCFDLSSISNPVLTYWCHSNDAGNGGNENELLVQIQNGGVWETVDTVRHVDNNWNERFVSLVPYLGNTIQVRFRGSTNNGTFTHDIAIDDVEVKESVAVDLEAQAFIAPEQESCFSNDEPVIVRIRNGGTNTLNFGVSNAIVSVNINAGAQNLNALLTSGTLAPAQSMDVTMSTTADLSVPGTYVFVGTVSISGDAVSANNSINFAVNSIPAVSSFPYTEDFASGAGGWTTGGNNSSWELGTPAGSVINSAASDTNSWITNLTGNYNPSEDSWVISPCFDFSGLTTPWLSMSVWWEIESGWDGAVLQSSIDGGVTWQNVGAVGDPVNWFNVLSISSTPGDQASGWSGLSNGGLGSGWITVSHTLDGLGGQSGVRLRIAVSDDGVVQYNGFAFDDVVIQEFGTANPDMELAAIISPIVEETGCGQAPSNLSLAVTNVGPISTGSFIAGYSIDGGGYTTETFTDSLAPGATDTITFSAPIDLSSGGIVDVFIELSGDSNLANDSLTRVYASRLVTSFPYVEDFEDAGALDPLWAQRFDDSPQDWTVFTGSTASFNTGPTADHTTGSGYYLYMEDSGQEHYPVDLYTPCFDLSAVVNPTMNFWYHSHSADSTDNENYLLVQIFSGGVWTTLDSIHHEDLNDWNEWSLPLTNYANQLVAFRFRGSTDNGDFSHDIAIDDFSITSTVVNVDLEAVSLESPVAPMCASSSVQQIARIRNVGFQTVDFSVTNAIVSINMSGPASQGSFQVLNGGNLVPGGIMDVIFSSNVDLSVAGTYTFAIDVSLSADGNDANDTITTSVVVSPNIDTYPYIEDFSSGANGWTSGGLNSTWELGMPNGTVIDTAASDTNAWMTGLNTTYSANELSWVQSPCLDFSSLALPQIQMSLWWECETNWDGAILQSSIDGGASWQLVGEFGDPDFWYNYQGISAAPGGQGNGWSGFLGFGSDGWVTASNSLAGLGGEPNVLVRILFASDGVGQYDGIAFDDIVIQDAPANDLKAFTFTSPSAGICAGAGIPVTLAVINEGTATVTNFIGGYALDGGTTVFENFTVSIAAGDTAEVTFVNTIDLSSGGLFTLDGFVALGGDANSANDMISNTIFASSTITDFPYVEDFEDGGVLDSLWWQGTDEDQDWIVDNGGTPSLNTGPTFDHTTGNATGYYMYMEDSGEDNFPVDLYSPCLAIDGLANPLLSFWYYSYDSNGAGSSSENFFLVEFLIAGVWTTIDTIGHVSPMWNEWSMPLNSYQGNGGIQVRFRGSTDNANFTHDIAIDDFSVTGSNPDDIGIAGISVGGSSICADDETYADVIVVNEGASSQASFGLLLQVNGPISNVFSYSVTDSLHPGESDTVLVGPIDMSASGTYFLSGTVFIGGDTNGENDTASIYVTAIPVSPNPTVSNAIACDTGEVVALTASGSGTLSWYDMPEGGSPIATGTFFITPPVMESTKYYVEQTAEVADFVGMADRSLGTSTYHSVYSEGLVFDVAGTSPITLDSVTCYVQGAGNMFINISDAMGNVIGSSIHIIDAATASANGGLVRLRIGTTLAPGTGYTIQANGSSVPGLSRTSSNVNYPYSNSTGSVIITSEIGGATNVYNYFYNWQVTVQGCPSERLAVEAYLARDVFEPNDVIPVALPSIGTNRNAYICDAADIDRFEVTVTSDEPNLRVSLSGETDMMELRLMDAGMNVLATDSNTTDDIVVIANGLTAGVYVIEVQGNAGYVGSDGYNLRAQHSDLPFEIRTDIDASVFEESFVLYPNPNTGVFHMEFVTDASIDIDIKVVDMYGKVILREHSRTHTGENRLSLDLGEVASGLYFVELQVDGKKFAKRIQVSH